MKCKSCGQELLEVVESEEPGTQAWYLADALPRLKRIEELSEAAYPSNPRIHYDPAARLEWHRLMDAQTKAEIAAGL